MQYYLNLDTVQSLYSTPLYNTYLDITLSCCGSQMFLAMDVILRRNYRKMTIIGK